MQRKRYLLLLILLLCGKIIAAQEIHFQEFIINDTLITDKHFSQNTKLNIEGRILNISVSHFLKDTARYEYWFEGVNNDWKTYQMQTNIYYQEIPGGTYIFHIRSKNNPDIQKVVSIKIQPLFYQEWWFIPSIFLFLLLIFGSAFYFVFLYKLRQEVQMRQVRNHIASDLHDEIGSTLSGISILSTIAQQQLAENHPSQVLIGRITDDALSIGNAMDDIVWSINPLNDDLEKIIARMRRYAAELFDAKEIDYQIVIPENLNEVKLLMEQRRDVYLIFKEAVNNLVKYSKCTQANIEIKIHNKTFELRIKDNGKGFDPNQESSRNGLKNMHARAISLEGNLTINSAIGKGTELVLDFEIS